MPDLTTEQKEKERKEKEAVAKLALSQKDDEPYEFSDPALKGKSPQEIEELFRMSKQVVESQGTKLRTVQTRLEEAQRTPPKLEPKGEKKSFFDDPDAAMARMEKAVEDQIAPLRREIREARGDLAAQGAFDDLRARHKDWDSVYPYIQNIQATQDPPFPQPNEPGLLNSLYYMAKAMMFEKGVISTWDGQAREEGDGDGGKTPPKGGAPPQHRSSPPPPPPRKKAETTEVTWDDLDESEKTLCKFYKMTPSDFRAMQDENPEDVITSTVGQPPKKD